MDRVTPETQISKPARLADVPREVLEVLLLDVIDTYRDCIGYDYPPSIAVSEAIREVLGKWTQEETR